MASRKPVLIDVHRTRPIEPPLFYRDGRPTTNEERGILPPAPVEAEPATYLRDPFADIKPWSWKDWAIPAAVVGVIVVGTIAMRVSVIGLVLALGTFGALAKIR